MADHPDIAFLKSDKVGKVLAAGLSELYREKPTFPIDYFAKWLLNYSQEQKNRQRMEEKAKQVELARERFAEEKETKEREQVEQKKSEESLVQEKEAFKDKIAKVRKNI